MEQGEISLGPYTRLVSGEGFASVSSKPKLRGRRCCLFEILFLEQMNKFISSLAYGSFAKLPRKP